jgi:hypothetical protein
MYCSFCAAVLEPNQALCPRCGRPTAIPAASPGADTRPSSVTAGIMLLLISWVIGLFSFAAILFRIGLRFSFIQTIFFSILWLALIIALWQRQNWARIAIVVLIVWNVANLALTFIRMAGMNAPMWGLSIGVGEAIMRIVAVLLLFRPQSNAWFKK